MTPRKNSKYFKAVIASRVLATCDGFSQAERLVGQALLGHYNFSSGRCDPGVDRLAKILKMSRSTVFAAISNLVDRGLFIRKTHGGQSHRNAYIPIWEQFEALNDSPSRRTLEPSSCKDDSPSLVTDTNEYESNETTPYLTQMSPRPGSGHAEIGWTKQDCFSRAGLVGAPPSRKDAAEAAKHRKQVREIEMLPPELREKAWLKAQLEAE